MKKRVFSIVIAAVLVLAAFGFSGCNDDLKKRIEELENIITEQDRIISALESEKEELIRIATENEIALQQITALARRRQS